MYNVYRINYDTKNEYYIIDTKKEYTMDNVPNSIFNRSKSGIDNIIKFKNKTLCNISDSLNLITSLPLAEYNNYSETDCNNLGFIINYNITDLYINENAYLEKSLVYSSVSIFALIGDIKYINYNFGGKTYEVTREQVEKYYPNYDKIVKDGINKSNFNMYLESKINNNKFIDNIFDKIFNIKSN